MKCTCGFTVPITKVKHDSCPICGNPMSKQTDDFLLHGGAQLVKEVRPGQVEMGRLVEHVLENKEFAIIEGPVGIGKSFAYAIPALLAGKRVIITTAKKQLQHQLAQKDLPFLSDKLGVSVKIAMIKGKANYACRLKANEMTKKEDQNQFLDWLKEHPSGDFTDHRGKRPSYFPIVTAEDCIGGSCRYREECGYWASKQKIKEAKVVIANHHVVAFDLRFGPGAILGPYDALIIDEAHQVPSAFRSAYSKAINVNNIKRVLKAVDNCGYVEFDTKAFKQEWDALFHSVNVQDGEIPPNPFGLAGDAVIMRLEHLMTWVRQDLKNRGVRERENEKYEKVIEDFVGQSAEDQQMIADLHMLKKAVERPLGALKLLKAPDPNTVLYVTTTDRNVRVFNAAPIKLGPLVGKKLREIDSVVITSATLAINGGFADVKDNLGLNGTLRNPENMARAEPRTTRELILPSPFDYVRQALLYTPYHIPHAVAAGDISNPSPERTAYISALARECRYLLTASRGNAFILFTATQDMRDVHAELASYDLPYPLFVQEDDAEATLRNFMETPDSVILGLKSFWEGVDVVGEKLRLVIITKLPFPQVTDPVTQAMARTIKNEALAKGLTAGNAESAVFNSVQIPAMLTDLRQGAGRLIRSKNDRGVLAILDARVWTGSQKTLPKPGQKDHVGYGKRAVKATGFTNVTGDFAYVEALFKKFYPAPQK